MKNSKHIKNDIRIEGKTNVFDKYEECLVILMENTATENRLSFN